MWHIMQSHNSYTADKLYNKNVFLYNSTIVRTALSHSSQRMMQFCDFFIFHLQNINLVVHTRVWELCSDLSESWTSLI